MGVVTVSTSVTRAPLGTSKSFTNCHTTVRRPVVVAFKNGTSKNPTLVAPQEPVSLPTDSPTDRPKRLTRANRTNKRVKAVSIDAAPPCAVELDYNEAAAKLENIYKLSPTEVSNVDDSKRRPRGGSRRVKNGSNQENSLAEGVKCYVVRSQRRKPKRLSLEKRIIKKDEKVVIRPKSKKKTIEVSGRDVDRLVRDYSVTTDLLSLDWKKMKIPAVLSSTEHTWLFSLMQPMKALLQVADNLVKDLEREPTDGELAKATNMTVQEVRRHIEVGRTARNKLVKHNLRLVLYVINKYFQELASGHKFQDLCQAGAKGLITAIDRFEPKRGLRLSTYGMFWIRHSIMRSMTISSFTRVPFGLESIRMQIQKGKLELLFELGRLPTDDEIIAKVGISPERFYDVMKASKSILSLNAKHSVTQEEFIKGITDIDGVEGDSRMQPALMRLAIDDVLDSLKPKESLVIRQRYGLDGKGDRTLGEIAGNLNISREMVRKYEVKAFMKLKHPARVDYLRRYVV